MPRDLSKFMPPPLVDSRCTECGAEVPAQFSSCDELFMSVITPLGLRWAESPDIARLQRLIIDTFGMQHPKRSCKSAKSYAAHLTGLCCGVEYNGAQSVYAALQRWLNGPVEAIGITRPTEPDYRGTLTIRYVYDAETEEEFVARVYEWAREVWAAYASQHEMTRQWIKQALGV
ncbi:MAG: hypothetical protein H5T62_01815 [Anaerolineae bacterium]|nr:hypothetical protein [Anaerolineae bacterium]